MSNIALKRLIAEVDLSDFWTEEILLLEVLASAHWEESDVAIRSHKQLASSCAAQSDDPWYKGKVMRYRRRLEARGLIRVRNKNETEQGKTAFEYELLWLANPPRKEQQYSDPDPDPNPNPNPDPNANSHPDSSTTSRAERDDFVVDLDLASARTRANIADHLVAARKQFRDDLARRALVLVYKATNKHSNRRSTARANIYAIALETIEAVMLPRHSRRREAILLRVLNNERELDYFKKRDEFAA